MEPCDSGSAAPRRWMTSWEVVASDFQGKVALVAGVGRVGQIGHAVARGLGRAGAKLLLADVNAVGLADRVKEFAAEGIAAKASAGDLTQPGAARVAAAAAQSHFGGLDVLINVAGGFFSFGPLTEVKPQIPARELALKLKTPLFFFQTPPPLPPERGAGRRLGQPIGVGLGGGGCDIAVHYHGSRRGAGGTVQSIKEAGRRAELLQADLTDPKAARALAGQAARALQRLDVLVNSAAIMVREPVEDVTPDSWDATLNLNLRAMFFVSQGAIPHLRRAKGKIINLADLAGLEPWPAYVPHCVSKAGVIMLTKGLARALAPDIVVHAIAPGAVLLPDDWDPKAREHLEQTTPVRRIGDPSDVVAAIKFLLADTDFITGTVLVVDGGRLIR